MLELLFGLLSECAFFLSSVRGKNEFPPRLSAEEEKAYLEQMKNGSVEAERALVEHNLRLVAHIAGKYRTVGLENDDLISVGTIGLIKAVRSYCPETGSPLSTYAARCIENAILTSGHFPTVPVWRAAEKIPAAV